MQTRFMGISHGSSRQHVTVWSIFGNGRYPGAEPKVVHSGPGCMPCPSHTPLFLESIAQKKKDRKKNVWMFNIKDPPTLQKRRSKEGGVLFSPLFQRNCWCGINTSVSCSGKHTHNIPVMWLDPKNLILHPWSDVYSLFPFPSGSAHWSLRPPLKEEAA